MAVSLRVSRRGWFGQGSCRLPRFSELGSGVGKCDDIPLFSRQTFSL